MPAERSTLLLTGADSDGDHSSQSVGRTCTTAGPLRVLQNAIVSVVYVGYAIEIVGTTRGITTGAIK